MNTELLPLFPLQAVLFPGSSLPLHIFEERYKILIAECLVEGKEFGINFANGNEFVEIGCTAIVASVLNRYDDGRMDIVVDGKRRYALDHFETGRRPYIVGHVSYPVPIAEVIDHSLATETIRLYNKMITIVYKHKLEQIREGAIGEGLSYVLAQKSGLDLLQRQRVLEISSENERLEVLRTSLADTIPKLERMEEVEKVIRGDGYL